MELLAGIRVPGSFAYQTYSWIRTCEPYGSFGVDLMSRLRLDGGIDSILLKQRG
jgi:hypothetical protein